MLLEHFQEVQCNVGMRTEVEEECKGPCSQWRTLEPRLSQENIKGMRSEVCPQGPSEIGDSRRRYFVAAAKEHTPTGGPGSHLCHPALPPG